MVHCKLVNRTVFILVFLFVTIPLAYCQSDSAYENTDSILRMPPPATVDTASAVVIQQEDSGTIYFSDAYPLQKQYYARQLDKKNFNKKKWKELTKNINYNEKEDIPKVSKGEVNIQHSFNLSSGLAQILLIIFVIVIIAFIAYKLIDPAIFRSNTKVESSPLFTLHDSEKDLTEYDLEALLNEALKKKEYRLGIRIYYLMVVKLLWQKKHIDWKIDKTNNDYLREMLGKPHYGLFREVTRLFEYIWYGEQQISETHAQLLIPKFKALLQQLEIENE